MIITAVGLLIAAVAFLALSFSEVSPAIEALIALPGAGGLLLALWELVKASIEHAHRIEEQSAGNAFALSATSHMAEVAFDKHVEFSEKYVAKANEGLWILFREGPTPKALQIASELYDVRRTYILWETENVADFLNKFEKALREIGASEHYLQHLAVGPKRSELIRSIYATFKRVVDLSSLPTSPTPEVAVTHIIRRLQDHLGISELTSLRRYYLEEAVKRAPRK